MDEILVLILIFAGFGLYGAWNEPARPRAAANGPRAARDRQRLRLHRLFEHFARSARSRTPASQRRAKSPADPARGRASPLRGRAAGAM